MTQKVQNTLKEFITSNKAFCDALKQNQIYLDSNILFELIIYYLTLNKTILNMLPEQDRTLLNDLINYQNFYIEGNFIIIGETPVSLGHLKEIVLEIEEKLKPSLKGKVIYLHDVTTKDLRIRPSYYAPNTKLRVISIDESKKNAYYKTVDREVSFEQTTRVNAKTRPYISESKENYIALVNDIVHKAITNTLDNYSIKYLKVIASYLQLYPFTTYFHGKRRIPYEVLTIDHNKIGIRKTTHNIPELNRLKRELVSLIRYQKQLEYERESQAMDERVKSNQLTLTEQTLIDVDKTKLKTMLEIYEIEHSPSVYNKNLIEHLALSFEEGTVSINRFFANPLLRVYLVDDDTTYFHCSIHLETLFNLINSNQLLEEIEAQRALRLSV